jgi:hypothetical protein
MPWVGDRPKAGRPKVSQSGPGQSGYGKEAGPRASLRDLAAKKPARRTRTKVSMPCGAFAVRGNALPRRVARKVVGKTLRRRVLPDGLRHLTARVTPLCDGGTRTERRGTRVKEGTDDGAALGGRRHMRKGGPFLLSRPPPLARGPASDGASRCDPPPRRDHGDSDGPPPSCPRIARPVKR